jgi:hypothetical protein
VRRSFGPQPECSKPCEINKAELHVDLCSCSYGDFSNSLLEVRISFRAVSRVLHVLAADLGIERAPCAQSVINWVMRLSIVRIECAGALRGLPLPHAPFSNGLIWMIDLSIALGSGKI